MLLVLRYSWIILIMDRVYCCARECNENGFMSLSNVFGELSQIPCLSESSQSKHDYQNSLNLLILQANILSPNGYMYQDIIK